MGDGTLRARCCLRGLMLLALVTTSLAVAQTRIMPLGDSITEAEAPQQSYRFWLWNALVAEGYAVDFVGNMTGVRFSAPIGGSIDEQHEGHWGWRADEVLAELEVWAEAVQPDIVLIHLGHNDLWQQQGVVDAIDDIEAIIAVLRQVNSAVQILLAQVIPASPNALSDISAFNVEIESLAGRLDTTQSSIVVVDQFTGFNAATDTYDGVHPNAAGEQKMAARWFEALRGLLEPGGARLDPPATFSVR